MQDTTNNRLHNYLSGLIYLSIVITVMIRSFVRFDSVKVSTDLLIELDQIQDMITIITAIVICLPLAYPLLFKRWRNIYFLIPFICAILVGIGTQSLYVLSSSILLSEFYLFTLLFFGVFILLGLGLPIFLFQLRKWAFYLMLFLTIFFALSKLSGQNDFESFELYLSQILLFGIQAVYFLYILRSSKVSTNVVRPNNVG